MGNRTDLSRNFPTKLNRPHMVKPNKRKREEQPNGAAKQDDNKRQRNIRNHAADSSIRDTLLDEIRALGGDENDLRLVENVPSDSEQGMDELHNSDHDGALGHELASFAKSLGLDQFALNDEASSGGEDEREDNYEGGDAWEPSLDSRGPVVSATSSSKHANHGEVPSRMVEPRPEWFNNPAASDDLFGGSPGPKDGGMSLYSPAIAALKAHAKSVWDRDSAAYVSSRAASSSHKFLSTIMTSGTMSDKVSALTLAIQESPLHNAKALENLVAMASKRSRSQALVALSALVDLFGPGLLLPPDRRLCPFHSQPRLVGALHKNGTKSWMTGSPLPRNITDAHLVLWLFEDWLKDAYFRTIKLLETWLNDEVDHSRLKALDFIYTLLREKPEQESNLLRLLVHKLGDLQKKIASRSSYLLLQLLEAHPAMKAIIIRTVEQEIILRPSQTARAKYYAITTLNQTVLGYKEPDIAHLLQGVYFSVFVSVLKEQALTRNDTEEATRAFRPRTKGNKGQKRSKPDSEQPSLDSSDKLVSALLTGVNRAVPFSNTDNTTLESHMDTLFRIAHSSNFNTSIQALILIQQISSSRGVSVDRFYRTLYESLLDPRLVVSSKQALYLNLLFKALKTDSSTRRIKAFIKRIMQIVSLHQPPFICGVIFLITELQKLFPDMSVLLEEPELTAEKGSMAQQQSTYDGRKRDPEFSNAHESCLWEVLPYRDHFHPSVSLFASGLLSKKRDVHKPELASHTLIHFLDRFVFRNPKTTESNRGSSIMQPAASISGTSNLLASQKAGSSNATVNAPAFWNKKAGDVLVEDTFFHNYFSYTGKQSQPEKRAKQKMAGAAAESEDEEQEEDIWNALVSSRPELGEVDDEDDSMGDLDDLVDSDSDISLDSDDKQDGWSVGKEDGEDVDMDPALFDSYDEGMSEAGPDNGAGAGARASVREETTASVAKTMVGSVDLKARRKLMKNLPVFASADDYEELLRIDDGLTG